MNIINYISTAIIPLTVVSVFIYSVIKKRDPFDDFLSGAAEGLKSAISILPSLIILMTAVGMFRESGALGILTQLISPFTKLIGIPDDCAALALIRPLSGSGALSVFENILENHSPDSFTGLVASVMMGSTETTFYTMAVYFSATKVKKTGCTLPAALTADFTGFVVSALAVRLLLTF